MNILLTGAAGFIGFHTTRALLARGHRVVGVDELNAYYDPQLKDARLAELAGEKNFRFVKLDIAEPGALAAAANGESFDAILHLAAQAGVRYALKDPAAYTRSTLVGHQRARIRAPSWPPQASRLCVFELCLWQRHGCAISRRCARRSSGVLLRRHQARGRTAFAFLRGTV